MQPTHNRDQVIGPRSRAEFARARALTPGGSMRYAPFFAPQPPYAAHGLGCWLTDLDGRRMLDCANNFFSLIHGHAFPPVVQALREVVERGTAFGLPTVWETRLAEAIRQRAPHLDQIRFAASGTEAVMFAIKAARAITGRPAIAKFEGAYHGAYDHVEVSFDSSPAAWGEGDPANVPYVRGTPEAVLRDVVVLPFNQPEICRRLLAAHASRLAALIIDPLAPRAGLVPAEAGFLAMVQEACRQRGILIIADEVVAFRLGHAGAAATFGLEPDLTALGKIIGGGLPVGAVAGPARHMAAFDHVNGKAPVPQGGTFSANPLTMAAGAAALAAYDRDAVARLNRLGDRFRARLGEDFADLPAQVTGYGSLFRLHLTRARIRDYRSCHQPAAHKRAIAAIQLAVLERGFLLTPNCSGALSTPMAEGELDDLASAIVESVREVRAAQPWEEG